jgi:hypothetical protein
VGYATLQRLKDSIPHKLIKSNKKLCNFFVSGGNMLGKNSKKVKKNLCLNKDLIIELQVKMVKQGVKTSLSNMIDAIILDYDKKNLSLTYLKYQEFLREEKEE